MSKYNKIDMLVDVTIKIGDRIETIGIFKNCIDALMKIPDGPIAWEHIYDMHIQDASHEVTDEIFVNICDMIGDMFMKNKLHSKCDISKLHVLNFINKYILPYAANEKLLAEMLCSYNLKTSNTHEIDLFPEVDLGYTSRMRGDFKGYFYKVCDPVSYNDYVPTGTLKDAYMIYRLLNSGEFGKLSEYKWYKSLRVLIVYLNIDNMIGICDVDDEEEKPRMITQKKAPSRKSPYKKSSEEETISSSDEEKEEKPIDPIIKEIKNMINDDNHNKNTFQTITMGTRSEKLNRRAFRILHMALRPYVLSLDLPEKENLIITMNEFISNRL